VVSKTSEIQTEVAHILESRWFKESTQLRNLLKYVVEETLAGRPDGLKEYSLGREVFHRAPDYDPRNDAIVRVQASLMRKRLAAYYEHEGRESRLRIELPRGGYHPVFQEVEQAEKPETTNDVMAVASSPKSSYWRPFAAGLAGGLVLALAIFGLARSWQKGPSTPGPAVWGTFVEPGSETIVSYGVPLFYAGAGVFVRDTSINAPGDESKGTLGRIQRLLGEPIRQQEDIYTGIGDLVGTHEITRWLEMRGVKASMANSHYLGHSDIEGKNLVVVSSSRFQTLLREMDLPSHFRFDYSTTDGGYFLDKPIEGEQRYYQPLSGAGVDTSYAVLSLWPGKGVENRILYLSGITTWATQGAAQYAVDAERLDALQRRLAADPAEGPRGRKSPFFQVLLRVEGKYNQVRTAEYLTHRYLDMPGHAINRAAAR
jgi:hypothetical protein